MTARVFLLLLTAGTARAAVTQPVPVAGGLVAGIVPPNSTVAIYKGIPYAAPPVHNLRWRAPLPPVAWDGVRKADRFAASCIQTMANEMKPWTYEFLPHGEISEDCLYLNVWAPAERVGTKLPVFFWIHGGGNTSGGAAVPIFDGENLAKKGLVVVTINYRVGLFGFFTHPELTREAGRSGNYGLLDQLAALSWVQDYIAGFGGDPARVTVAGQSAGANNIHILVASPLARGLFARAIEESGSDIKQTQPPMETQEKDGLRFAEAIGAPSVGQLRTMPARDLMDAMATAGRGAPSYFDAVIDKYLLMAEPNAVLAQGKQNDVPELTGVTKDDFNGARPKSEISAAAFARMAAQRFGSRARVFLQLYPAGTMAQAGQARNDSARDEMRTSLYLWEQIRAKLAKTKAWSFFWDHTLPGPDAAMYGAFHNSEVPYVFNSLQRSSRPFTSVDRQIADTMSSYWANFAATGDPNGKGLAHWPAVSERPDMTMELGDKNMPIGVAGSKAKQDFFTALYPWARP